MPVTEKTQKGKPLELIKEGPFRGLVRNKYAVILADPPWRYKVRSDKGKGKSAERHYPTMSLAEMMALPVRDLAAKDCVLFMWVIDSHVEQAMELTKAWGFTYKTVGLYWAKTNQDGKTFFTGTGHWTRANPEHAFEAYLGDTEQEAERCFLNTLGAPKRTGKDVPRLIVSPRREHSRKPDETWSRIERLVDGPYLELFGRTQHGDWSVWGNEPHKFVDPLLRDEISELV